MVPKADFNPARAQLVLVVDDSAEVRLSVRRILERSGFLVMEAVDGNDCLKRLAERRPDLILADLNMPNRNGLAILAALNRAMDRIPVIAMSGCGLAYLNQAKELGAREVLSKPTGLDSLVDTVRHVLTAL